MMQYQKKTICDRCKKETLCLFEASREWICLACKYPTVSDKLSDFVKAIQKLEAK